VDRKRASRFSIKLKKRRPESPALCQSREGIDELLALPRPSSYHSAQPDHPGVDHWLRLLLRIITCLDVMVCARHSSFSVGILEILHMCHLRLPRSGVSYMITGYANSCITHEGSSLVLGFQHVFKEIEEQRNLGRDWKSSYESWRKRKQETEEKASSDAACRVSAHRKREQKEGSDRGPYNNCKLILGGVEWERPIGRRSHGMEEKKCGRHPRTSGRHG
jgi:hypothetical protein